MSSEVCRSVQVLEYSSYFLADHASLTKCGILLLLAVSAKAFDP